MNWLIIVALVALVYFFYNQTHHIKQRYTAIVVVVLLLVFYISFVQVTKGHDIDYSSMDGVQSAAKLYFSWLGTMFVNLKELSGNAVKMDWDANKTLDDLGKK